MDRTVTTVIDTENYQQIAGRKKYVHRIVIMNNKHSLYTGIHRRDQGNFSGSSGNLTHRHIRRQ